MKTLPIETLINDYDKVSQNCKNTNNPIFLANNGKIELVVMSYDAYQRQQDILKLKERLIESETGNKYTLDELDVSLRKHLS